MDPFALRPLGGSGVMLPALGFGGAPIGDNFDTVSDAQADGTLAAAWDAGIRYYDTAPWYGWTKSEHRIGRALRERPMGEVILSSKVGLLFRRPADPEDFARRRAGSPRPGNLNFEVHHDYSYDGIMRSYEDSMQRMGISRIDMLLIHDLDLWHLRSQRLVDAHLAQLATSGMRALADLRKWGDIRAIGAGVNDVGTIPLFLEVLDLDFFLLALRYTLGEQSALPNELSMLEERGIGLVVGGVFSSGLYAAGPIEGARFNYRPPTPEQLARVAAIMAVCARHDVPLNAAALQFPLHHPAATSVIPGAVSPAEVAANVAAMRHEVPADLWAELKHEKLIAEDAPTP
jgi:D-threo-aldose 1-dehydrogenase